MKRNICCPRRFPAFPVLVILSAILFVSSCSFLPFQTKEDDTAKAGEKASPREEKGERLDLEEPKPGDIRVVDGIEYIYTRNKRYMLTPYEQEYVWVRKDQYVPGVGESVMAVLGGTSSKDRAELEARIAKLEAGYKEKGIAPQMAYPAQMASLPQPAATGAAASGPPALSFTYPSPKMKRRIIVLPVDDGALSGGGRIGEFATRRLVSRLEQTNGIICIDPGSLPVTAPLTGRAAMRALNEVYGVQAIIKATLSDIEKSPSTQGAPLTSVRLDMDVYDTETGAILKRLSGRNPSFLSSPQGNEGGGSGLTRSIDLSVDMVADDLLRSVLSIDWHARVASLEPGKIYITAGRQSGLEKGAILEVYSPGTEVLDSKTRAPLGKTKGDYKGELKVSELFGVDASWATPINGGGFTATDLVYVKKE